MDMVMGKSESPRPGRELLKVEHFPGGAVQGVGSRTCLVKALHNAGSDVFRSKLETCLPQLSYIQSPTPLTHTQPQL